MTKNPLTAGDLDYFAFSPDADFEPLIAAAQVVAQDLDASSNMNIRIAAGLVRQLGLAELMLELQARGQAVSLLFLMANTLGYANAPAAWAGLSDAPTRLLSNELSGTTIAWPRTGHQAQAHSVWLPMHAEAEGSITLIWPDMTFRSVVGPAPLPAGSKASELLGMPDGVIYAFSAGVLTDLGVQHKRQIEANWLHCLNAQAALLLGLVDGVCRRLVVEAYVYAKQRQSGGKPIAQHQAVALRLADLVLDQQALSLYAQAAVDEGAFVDCCSGPFQSNKSHIADLSFRIGRDAVQVAAAHGYVEGLPFKRLFEQLRTLTSALTVTCADQPMAMSHQIGRAVHSLDPSDHSSC